jgi:hypothetical protein
MAESSTGRVGQFMIDLRARAQEEIGVKPDCACNSVVVRQLLSSPGVFEIRTTLRGSTQVLSYATDLDKLELPEVGKIAEHYKAANL